MAAGRWRRRLVIALAVLLGLWALAWLGGPPLLKWQLQKQASQALGRTVTVDRVDVRPWSLELEITGLKVADAAGTAEQFSLARLYVDAELQSLLRLAPVVDALKLEQPRLRLRHLGQGRYDVDDVLQRLNQPDASPPGETPKFALFNLELTGGGIEFVDAPVGVTHRLEQLVVRLPFLSNLDSRRDVKTRPQLAFELNGSAFDSSGETAPFADAHQTDLRFKVPSLDLAPYLPYWPAQWPLRPQAGFLHLALQVAFEQREAPQVILSGDVALSGIRLQQVLPGAAPADALAFERLAVDIRRAEPLARQIQLGKIAWQGPQLAVSRDAQGRLNLQRMAEGFVAGAPKTTEPAPAAAAPAEPWRIGVDEVIVSGATLRWDDAAVRPQARLVADDLKVTARDLTWPVQRPVPFELSTRLGTSSLTVQGSATQANAQAQLHLGALPLSPFAPYLAQTLAVPLSGQVAAELSLDWQAAQPGKPMGLVLGASTVTFSDLALGAPRSPQAALQSLVVQGARVDLAQRAVSIEQLQIQRPRVQLERDAQGQWSVLRWLKPAPATAPARPVAASAPPWTVALRSLQLGDGALRFKDAQPAEPVQLSVSGIQLQLQNLQPMAARQTAMPLSFAARVADAGGGPNEAGRLNYKGALRLPAPAPGRDGLLVKGQLQADHLPVHALVPYFGERLNLDLLRADTSYCGAVELGLPATGLALSLAGDVALEEFRANTLAPSEELLAWKALNLRGLQLALAPGQPLRLAVNETVLSDYFARVIISEQGRINLQGLVKDSGAPSVPAGSATGSVTAVASGTVVAAAPAPVAAPAGPAPDIRFGPISLVNGRVFFSDRFIQPNYSANLSELSGGLSAFSNASTPGGGTPQLADLALRGRAEGTAALEIVGKLNPLAQPLALDIQGKVRDLELPPLSPYSAKYAGYGIDRGKLSVDVKYSIAPDGQLNASNQIVLNQLAFGNRIEGSEAPNLPVKLAVALLADRNGMIDINLPVSGSLNDPQFRLAPIIFKLIFNLIGKAITAPFSLLAGALGGGGDELSQVAFAPGSAVLSDEGRQRLDKIAKALADRPALQLTVIGHSDLDAERSGLRRARLDAQVQAEKRRALARSGGAVTGTVVVTPAEYPALLKEVYKRADISKPRNLIGLAKDLPVPEMEALLLAAIPVTADTVRELAVARGVAVKDYLASRELPEDRMFLGAPRLAREGDRWVPQAELKLAAR